MIFLSIIALFFGLLMVSFLLVLEGRLGLLLSALLIGIFGFLGSGRLAHNKPGSEVLVGALGTLLPLWLLPYYTAAHGDFPRYIPALAIITALVLAAIAITVWWERKRYLQNEKLKTKK